MSDFLEEKHFSSASDFLDYLQLRNPNWLPANTNTSPCVFRGQGNSEWEILPNSLRPNQAWSPYFNYYKHKYFESVLEFLNKAKIEKVDGFIPSSERLAQLTLQIAAELEVVEEFADLAEQVGHQLPGSDDAGFLWDVKKPMWERVVSALNLQSTIKHNYHIFAPRFIKFALAQHHGVPTRLIDWTQSPLVADVFAVEGVPAEKSPNDISVWALNCELLDIANFEIIRHRRSKIPYLHAQSGLFIYDHTANFKYLKNGFWSGIEKFFDYKNTSSVTPVLRKVSLISSEASELLRLLSVEGVTRAHLMPTLDNVTKTLETRYKLFNS